MGAQFGTADYDQVRPPFFSVIHFYLCVGIELTLIYCAWQIRGEEYPGAIGTQSGSELHTEQPSS